MKGDFPLNTKQKLTEIFNAAFLKNKLINFGFLFYLD
jgi:hypothetical protein